MRWPAWRVSGMLAAMSFDVSTLYFAGAVLSSLQVLGLLPLSVMNRRLPGMNQWLGSSIVYSVALWIYLLQISHPDRHLTFFLPTVLSVLAGVLFYFGACRFTGTQIYKGWMVGVSACCLAGYAWCLYSPGPVGDSIQGRIQMIAVQSFFVYVMTAAVLWRERRVGLVAGTRFAAIVSGFFALCMIYRLITWTVHPRAAWISGSSPENVLMAFFAIVASYFWMFWIILMIHQFQRMEISASLAAKFLAEEALLNAKNALERQRSLHLRQVMARDLHDGIGGITATLAMLASLGREEAGENRDKLLKHIETIAVEGNQEVRVLMSSLETGVVRWEDWLGDLRRYSARAMDAAGIRLNWEVEGTLPDEPMADTAAAISLMRAVKESVHNLVRHAGAFGAWMRFCFEGGAVAITVVDDGGGIRKNRPGGRGMKNMLHRAKELGGSCEVRESDGTTVEFVIPLPLAYAVPRQSSYPLAL